MSDGTAATSSRSPSMRTVSIASRSGSSARCTPTVRLCGMPRTCGGASTKVLASSSVTQWALANLSASSSAAACETAVAPCWRRSACRFLPSTPGLVCPWSNRAVDARVGRVLEAGRHVGQPDDVDVGGGQPRPARDVGHVDLLGRGDGGVGVAGRDEVAQRRPPTRPATRRPRASARARGQKAAGLSREAEKRLEHRVEGLGHARGAVAGDVQRHVGQDAGTGVRRGRGSSPRQSRSQSRRWAAAGSARRWPRRARRGRAPWAPACPAPPCDVGLARLVERPGADVLVEREADGEARGGVAERLDARGRGPAAGRGCGARTAWAARRAGGRAVISAPSAAPAALRGVRLTAARRGERGARDAAVRGGVGVVGVLQRVGLPRA